MFHVFVCTKKKTNHDSSLSLLISALPNIMEKIPILMKKNLGNWKNFVDSLVGHELKLIVVLLLNDIMHNSIASRIDFHCRPIQTC